MSILDFLAWGFIISVIISVLIVIIVRVQAAATAAERRALSEQEGRDQVNRLRARKGLKPGQE